MNMFKLFSLKEEMKKVKMSKEAVLKDGNTVYTSADDFVEGADIYIKSDDGTDIPLLEGTYYFDSGVEFEVNEEGKISKIIKDEADKAIGDDVATEDAVDASKETKMAEEGPSAYIELPVGTHTIGDKIYVVEEITENIGTENEYKCNVIVSITPVGGDVAMDDTVDEEITEEKTETEETMADETINQDIESRISKLEAEKSDLMDRVVKLEELVSGLASKEEAMKKQIEEFSALPAAQSLRVELTKEQVDDEKFRNRLNTIKNYYK